MNRKHSIWPSFGGQPADVVAITQLMNAYGHCLDSFRLGEWSCFFTEDAVLELVWQDDEGNLHPMNDGVGFRSNGREAIVEFMRGIRRTERPLPRRAGGPRHDFVNQVVDVRGDSAMHRAVQVHGRFQYENELVRTSDGWRFSKMVVIFNEHERFPIPGSGGHDET